jgi:hypothetical protein
VIALVEDNLRALQSNSAAVSRRFSDGNVPLNGQRTARTAKARPTIEELREYLEYEPETGVLRWRKPKASNTRPGDIITGKGAQGYLRVRFNGHLFYAHRVAFALMHGRWPHPCCDHINGNRTDNRAANLRECNYSGNVQNTRKPHNNTSGVKGVCYHKPSDGWIVNIQCNRVMHSKYFKRFDDAAAHAKQLREELHGEFARH